MQIIFFQKPFISILGLLLAILTLNSCQSAANKTMSQNSAAAASGAPTIVDYFRVLELPPIREKLKQSILQLNSQEQYIAGETLLMSGSKGNAKDAFALFAKTTSDVVPCIYYFEAEGFYNKGMYADALKSLALFQKEPQRKCPENSKSTVFQCCPDSKYRNAKGLKKVIESAMAGSSKQEIGISLDLHKPLAKQMKTPLVKWENLIFLFDTGAEHSVWNSACAKELGLKIDTQATYGGGDSLNKLVVTSFAVPTKAVFKMTPKSLAGFVMDLTETGKLYGAATEKFCGIVSPQKLIPSGIMAFDWSVEKIVLCQGEKCRAQLDIPVNCAMPMLKGRPYLSMSVNGESERLFLIDSGANSTSANENYFLRKPVVKEIQASVTSVSATSNLQNVIEKTAVSLCGAKFSIAPFPVRAPDRGWEWNENGKIGMDLIFESILAFDFGNSMALFR